MPRADVCTRHTDAIGRAPAPARELFWGWDGAPESLTRSRRRARLRDVTSPSVVRAGDLPQMLRDVGLRVTRPRVAVLGAVHAHPHSDTDSLIAAARRDVPDVSHQAVYDCLHALTRSGLVRRIQPPGSVAR